MPRHQQGRVPTGLGKALVQAAARPRQQKRADRAALHYADLTTLPKTTAEPNHLASVTDRNELDEFLSAAMAADEEFEVEKAQVVVLESKAFQPKAARRTHQKAINQALIESYAHDADNQPSEHMPQYPLIPIPRRPEWTSSMSPDELMLAERDAFLGWRRKLADLEENSGTDLTPFEKNVEVWKQLWRVMERCSIICQIVDARNPLLYRSVDLESYAKELNPDKTCVLILNKADYLSVEQREMWAEYFTAHDIEFVFWSAASSTAQTEREERERKERERVANRRGGGAQDQEELRQINRKLAAMALAKKAKLANEKIAEVDESKSDKAGTEQSESESESISDEEDDISEDESSQSTQQSTSNRTDILSRDQLLDYLRHTHQKHHPEAPASTTSNRLNVGMIGYPNVGKSSTINALMQAKRVTVGATPGKTKHFQTLNIGDDLCLCDCPGLVFPSFTASRAELVCNGIMPIDQMREYANYTAPVALLVRRVNPAQFKLQYSLVFPTWNHSIDRTISIDDVQAIEASVEFQRRAEELMFAHARMRGFLKDHGRPDSSRSARLLLKDLFNGKLLYCYPPPGLTDEQRDLWDRCVEFQSKGARIVGDTHFGDEEDADHHKVNVSDSSALHKRQNVRQNAWVQEETRQEFNDEIDPTNLVSNVTAAQSTMGMSKKQLLRARQRERHFSGKQFKTRKTVVAQEAVQMVVGGNSMHAALKMGLMQATKINQPEKLQVRR